jgi:hypothetical protein
MADFSFDSYADTAAPAAAAPVASAQKFSMEATATPAPQAVPIAESSHEIDLSSEWEGMTDAPAATAAPAQSASEAADEVKFYLGQSMWAEAAQGITKLETIAPGSPEIARFRAQLEAGRAPAPAAAATGSSVAEFSFDVEAPAEPVAPPPPPPKVSAPPPPPPKVVAPPPKVAVPPAAAAKDDLLGDFVLDLEDSLGDDFAFSGKPGEKPAAPASAAAAAAAAPAPKPAARVAPPPPPKPAPAPTPIQAAEAHSALSDLFDEFKEDVEQSSSAGDAEDPDTHYNLGVAFKEMGLLDEAIGELQKVCSAIERGHPFTQVIQAYTWLASCFVEKGVPEAAVKWYEKALKAPAIDEESKMAVYYELAAAHESAGNKKAALSNFMEVYGTNIDYRDVAERIKGLRT